MLVEPAAAVVVKGITAVVGAVVIAADVGRMLSVAVALGSEDGNGALLAEGVEGGAPLTEGGPPKQGPFWQPAPQYSSPVPQKPYVFEPDG